MDNIGDIMIKPLKWREIRKIFLSTVLQYIAYGVLLVLVLILFTQFSMVKGNIVDFICIIMPVIFAVSLCAVINKQRISFDNQKLFSRPSLHRLAIRFVAVFCFILCGVCAELFTQNRMHHNLGEIMNMIIYLLESTVFYAFVAIFPSAFALMEYFCVEFDV